MANIDHSGSIPLGAVAAALSGWWWRAKCDRNGRLRLADLRAATGRIVRTSWRPGVGAMTWRRRQQAEPTAPPARRAMPPPAELRQVIARLEALSSPTSAEMKALRPARLLLAIRAEGPAH